MHIQVKLVFRPVFFSDIASGKGIEIFKLFQYLSMDEMHDEQTTERAPLAFAVIDYFRLLLVSMKPAYANTRV